MCINNALQLFFPRNCTTEEKLRVTWLSHKIALLTHASGKQQAFKSVIKYKNCQILSNILIKRNLFFQVWYFFQESQNK